MGEGVGDGLPHMHLHVSYCFKNVLPIYLGDNWIQNFHFGRYIVGYRAGNLVLRRRSSF